MCKEGLRENKQNNHRVCRLFLLLDGSKIEIRSSALSPFLRTCQFMWEAEKNHARHKTPALLLLPQSRGTYWSLCWKMRQISRYCVRTTLWLAGWKSVKMAQYESFYVTVELWSRIESQPRLFKLSRFLSRSLRQRALFLWPEWESVVNDLWLVLRWYN